MVTCRSHPRSLTINRIEIVSFRGHALKLWINTLLRLFTGAYFVLTSIYCLLAFLPYTYFFLIKAPPYAWMPWFVRHQAALYWLAAGAALLAGWNLRDARRTRDWRFFASIAALASAGIYLTLRPFLSTLQNSPAAYWWSLAAFSPLVLASLWRSPNSNTSSVNNENAGMVPYSAAVLIACILSVIYLAGARLRIYSQEHATRLHAADAEFALWSLISHIMLALAIFSLINLVSALAIKTTKPRAVRLAVNGFLIFAALGMVLYHFLASALSFNGRLAQV
jgi:hypothetical protein